MLQKKKKTKKKKIFCYIFKNQIVIYTCFYMLEYKNILIEYTSKEENETGSTHVSNWTRHHSIVCEDVLSHTHLLFLSLEQYHYVLTWIVNKREEQTKNEVVSCSLLIVVHSRWQFRIPKAIGPTIFNASTQQNGHKMLLINI